MARQVCSSCQRPQVVCYCHLIKVVENEWPVHIVQHKEESKHAIGTARIAELGLKHCSTEQVSDNEVIRAGKQGVLVYPGDSTTPLSELKNQGPQPLIFIDASWRKSKKIFYESDYLQSLPRLAFNFPQDSRYLIRKEPKAGYCSTLEAIAYSLSYLEGKANKYQKLLAVMDWMISQQLGFIKDNKIDASSVRGK